jgi:hypothetical protein
LFGYSLLRGIISQNNLKFILYAMDEFIVSRIRGFKFPPERFGLLDQNRDGAAVIHR